MLEFGFAKPAPAKSALDFARKSSAGSLSNDSGRRKSEGGGRRTVKLVPPLEASMTDRQTSFSRLGSGGSRASSGGLPPNGVQPGHGGGGEQAALMMDGGASGELFDSSPASRAHLARQQLGLPPASSSLAAQLPLLGPPQ